MEIIINHPAMHELISIDSQLKEIKTQKENQIDFKFDMDHDETLLSQLETLYSTLQVLYQTGISEPYEKIVANIYELQYKYWLQNTTVEQITDEYDQHIETLETDREFVLHAIADMVGLDQLINIRRTIGKQMSKQYRLQKEHYDLQKQRYEECKKNSNFKETDREYIAYHKQLNKEHIEEWERLRLNRELLSELVVIIDPTDQDIGFDEDEDI